MKKAITVNHPTCCDKTRGEFLVTHRRAKQLERSRRHQCKECGAWFEVDMSSGRPVVKHV